MIIKLCGLRRLEDIEYVNEFMPDYVGFIFAENSKRTVTIEQAKALSKNLSSYIQKVGVFVNQPVEYVAKAVDEVGLNVYQLHGDEDCDYIENISNTVDADIWKAVRVRSSEDIAFADNLGVDAILLDSFSNGQYGGTGKLADWDIITKAKINTQIFLAGGLDENNITNAIKTVKPYGVDISGGIETDGFKDRLKIKRLMNLIR
ncbi:MAG TPA: phosphoribosylanthranilate isomerase [Clostridiales bacterium]|nr:phosphoribosylanthranilate isomerase [Clostridiales bacterium]